MKTEHSIFCPINRYTTKRQLKVAERELELLEIAEGIMEREGFSGLTMDRLVALCEYSKGTVYNHFGSKEDLLSALCIKSMKTTLELFQRACEFKGNSREKLLAVHFAYRLHALMHPTLFMSMITAQSPAITEKASSERLAEQGEYGHAITSICDGLHHAAVKSGELSLAVGRSLDGLVFASWAMSFGTNALMTCANAAEGIERVESDTALLANASLLMDGMGWKPLSTEWDYQRTWRRIAEELFAEELESLGKVRI